VAKPITLNQKAVRATWLSITGNLLMVFVKGIAGILGNSYALVADGIESLTDVFSSFIVLFGIKYSSRPADKNHPYGHGRAEPLVTFLVVGFLLGSAGIIAYQSIVNIQIPHELPKPFTLFVLAAIILVKEIFFRIIITKSKETNSSSLKADAWHHRSDAITSVTAFIGISIALILGKGYETADDWAALIACVVIVYNAYRIFRPALGEIMDEHVYDELIAELREIAKQVPGIVDTEKCLIRKTGMQYRVSIHASVNGNISVTEGHHIAHLLSAEFKRQKPEILSVQVHVEPDR